MQRQSWLVPRKLCGRIPRRLVCTMYVLFLYDAKKFQFYTHREETAFVC